MKRVAILIKLQQACEGKLHFIFAIQRRAIRRREPFSLQHIITGKRDTNVCF
jgi:hypothetical protein